MDSIKIRDRKTKEVIENKENKFTLFLYNSYLGRIILKILSSRLISKLAGAFLSSSFSQKLIPGFIKKNNIDMNDYEKRKYQSFNDFFTREIIKDRRPINLNKEYLISPADSKLAVYKITKDKMFKIKDSNYSVYDLINNEKAQEYEGGYALIFRLEVDDYHRYCYIDDGTIKSNHLIKGVLHTVRPIALKKHNIYKRNSRSWAVLNTKNFGEVIQVEVGAMLVGKIVNYHQNYNFKKGEEKGYFKFGGSTIVLLVKSNTINIDQDIIENSNKGMETIIKFGEKIAKKTKKND